MKDIKGYGGLYQITSDGRVISNNRKKGELKPGVLSNGYRAVTLASNGKLKCVTIHRLVALHYLDNPSGYPQVNHKDGDKTNNDVSNLEWCSNQMNIQHRFASLGQKGTNSGRYGKEHTRAKRVECLDKDMKLVKVYDTVIDAAKDGHWNQQVSKAAKTKTLYHGFNWVITESPKQLLEIDSNSVIITSNNNESASLTRELASARARIAELELLGVTAAYGDPFTEYIGKQRDKRATPELRERFERMMRQYCTKA